MKYAIVGSRDFKNYEQLKAVLSRVTDIEMIISGGARGADSLAERYAKEYNIELTVFPAEWEKYGKGAGFIRNKDIVDNADKVIAFWDGISRGTKHSVGYATKIKKPILIVTPLTNTQPVLS